MKFYLPILLAGALALTLTSTTASAADIVDTAVAGNFKTLVAAVKAAGLVDTLKGPGPFTVFAPTDEAFAKLPAGTLETLLKPENKAKLQSILTYHVVAGKVMAQDVVKLHSAKTVEGQSIAIKTVNGGVMVNNAHVTKTDIVASQWRDPRDRHGHPAEMKVQLMHLLTGATGYVGGRLLKAPRARRFGSQMLVPQPGGARLAGGSRHRSGAGRPAAAGVSGCGVLRRGHRLLPGPFHEQRGRVRGRGAQSGSQLCAWRRARPECGASSTWAGWRTATSFRAHMRSRAETGNILRSSGIPVIEFQASIVIGSGSASFEMIRALVERLPVMITPRWVNTAAQPIAIEDVIEYLAAAARLPADGQPYRSKSAARTSLLMSGSCASTPGSGNCGAGSCACRSSVCRCRAAG